MEINEPTIVPTVWTGNTKALSLAWQGIDALTDDVESTGLGGTDPDEITKRHWKDSDLRTNCSNKTCKKKFTFLERHHHCRRCGEVFCNDCVSCRRKLNKLAQPDPDGRSYKVCQSCFEEGTQTEGTTRRLTEDFRRLHYLVRDYKAKVANGYKGASWRNRIDISLECKRLLTGFETSIGKSEMKRTIMEMTRMVSLPDWQKSPLWLQHNMAGCCQFCRLSFGLVRSKQHCAICSIAMCKSCSTQELLIYVPDAGTDDTDDGKTKLVVIKIIGSPEVEPKICIHLRICGLCKDKLIEIQVAKQTELQAPPCGEDMMVVLSMLQDKFAANKEKIESQLTEYQEIIDSLEDNTSSRSHHEGALQKKKSNMKTLAKAQEDLSDFFTSYLLAIQQLKRLRPDSDTRAKLVRNFIKSKCDFYTENQFAFRRVKRKLSDVSPPEVLEFIQKTMNKNSIISAHLYLRQLIFEALMLCERHHVHDQLPRMLTAAEEVVEKEARVCITKSGEDWEQHMEILQEMIKTEIKLHKLIRPSRTLTKQQGAQHIAQILQQRTEEVLNQVRMQLAMKSAHRSFPLTKEILQKTLAEVIRQS